MGKFLTFLLGMFFSFSTLAQRVSISGKVTDGNENKPIQNAVVALLTPKDSILYSFTRTDSAGKYILKNIPSGKYILMTSQPNYADVLNDIEVNGDTKIPSTIVISTKQFL